MILILTLIYLLCYGTYANPLSSSALITRDIVDVNATSRIPVIFEATKSLCTKQRTVWDIIWSCLAIIFACSWVSVHPNIPDEKDSKLKVAMRRLELMFWAIITPELIIMWAIRQWIGSRKLERKYKRFGWTKTHGFFIQMGGFMLYEQNVQKGILSPEQLESLYRDGKINIPRISEKEIQDHSKADALGKTLVLVQTTWFIAQCISRHIQHFNVTELELVTVAFAILNGAMYFLWWNKPLDVRTTVSVHLLDDPTHQERIPKMEETNLDTFIHNITFSAMISHLHDIKNAALAFNFQDLLTVPFMRFIAIINTDIHNIIPEGSTHVSAFYALHAHVSEQNRLAATTGVIATIFGAIHLVGWSFAFHTYVERLLWRVSSLIITGTFTWLLFFGAVAQFFEDKVNLIEFLAAVLSLTPLPIYIIARFILLIIACMGLRDLPPGALTKVEWISFLPHV